MVMLDFFIFLNFPIKEAMLIDMKGFFVKVSKMKLLNLVDGQTNLLANIRNGGSCFLFTIVDDCLDSPCAIWE